MNLSERVTDVRGKLHFYKGEVVGLKGAEFSYVVIFGLILALLLPVLIIEVIVLLTLGLDAEICQTRSVTISRGFVRNEVPAEFRVLIPYAKKWGIGNAEEREALLKSESISELKHLNQIVGPKLQKIDDWLTGYSETELAQSETAGYFLFLCVAYEEVAIYLDELQVSGDRTEQP